MRKQWYIVLDILAVLVGIFLYAFGVAAFIQPRGIITGGATGIGLLVNRLTGVSLSVFMLILNSGLFLLGLFVLGKKFAATTAVSTFFYPVALEFWHHVLPEAGLTPDFMLSAIFGGLFIGCAVGLTMRVGSSTGGMDIPPLVLNKWFHLPVAPVMYLFDMVILLAQALHSTMEETLYGILVVIVYTTTLNKILVMGQSKIEVKIISEKIDEIRQAILTKIDRGGTLLKSRTGFKLRETELLLSIISPNELNRTEKLIHAIDPNAFLVVSKVSEVRGRGFTLNKQYLNKKQPGEDSSAD